MLYLDFEINKEIIFRYFIGDDLFKKIVYKVVDMNESLPEVNVTLLDKIKEFERVLKLLIKISRKRVDDGKPRDFTSSVVGDELRVLTI